MLILSRCSRLIGQFAQQREHGKSYCVGVRHFMFKVWLFVLAHRACLPDTVDFVLYDSFSIFPYMCAQRSAVEYRQLFSGTRSSKYCRLWWQMLGKRQLFRGIVVFRLLIHSGLRKLRVDMAHFKKYRSFKCLVRVNCVSPFIVIILIRSKNLERRLFSLGEQN